MSLFGLRGKSLACVIALIALGGGFAGVAGCGLVGYHPTADRGYERAVDAYDHIVPGRTRTADLGGIGIDVHDALVVPPAPQGMMGPAARGCLATGRPCHVLFFQCAGGNIALLVLDGRVIDKVFIAQT